MSNIVSEIKQLPFLRLLIPLISGIALQLIYPLPAIIFFVLGSFSSACFFIFNFSKSITNIYNMKWVFGWLIYLTIFCIGALLTHLKLIEYSPVYPENEISICGVIYQKPETKQNSIQALLKIDYISDSTIKHSNNTKIIVNFPKDSTLTLPVYGDLVLAKAKVNNIANFGNPLEFDYKDYLKNQGITGQVFLQKDNWKIIDKNKAPFILTLAENAREKLIQIFKNQSISGDELAVLSALILGYKEDLTSEIKDYYVKTGTLHVLAVSGMHVGLLYFCLQFILFFFNRSKIQKITNALIIIIIMIFFAFLTGLSASVCRAVVVFSLFIAGKSFNKQTNYYNLLAASAFILLIINPLTIKDVGFQLSYVAVWGILFFYPRINTIFYSKYWIIDKTWSLTSTSLAAMIGTLPLSFYYFNQFPNYSILANIPIIVISTIIMYVAIVLFAIAWIPYISTFVGLTLKYLTALLNYTAMIFSNLPYATTNYISITNTQLILFNLIIILIIIYLTTKKRYTKLLIISCLCLFMLTKVIDRYNYFKGNYLVIFNNKLTSMYLKISDNQVFIHELNDNSIELHLNKFRSFISKVGMQKPYLHNLNDSSPYKSPNKAIQIEKRFITLNNKLLYIADNEIFTKAGLLSDLPIKIDYLVIKDELKIKNLDLLKKFESSKIVLTASLSNKYLRKIENYCNENNLQLHNIKKSGALMVKF